MHTDRTPHSPGLSRRGFVCSASTLAIPALGIVAAPRLVFDHAPESEPVPWIGHDALEEMERPEVHNRFPATDYEKISSVVGASHSNIDRVAELVEAQPTLARAAIDWGFGDWESALGAASHTGRREIAELLMKHGARPNIFTAAMMGWVDVVRGYVEATPEVKGILGPHGITLMQHAKFGGDEAKSVVEYLEEVGGADAGHTNEPLTEEEMAPYTGSYRYGKGEDQMFEIKVNRREMLSFVPAGASFGRALFHQGNHTFHPGGADSVKVVFNLHKGQVITVMVHDPQPVMMAHRIGG